MNGSRQRILRATAASLSWQPQGADGEPADPGAVTVSVVRSDGTEVIASTAAAGATTAPRTIAVTVAQTALLDELTATWMVGTDVVAVTVHDIVGGYYFTSADLRSVEPSTADATKDPSAKILSARAEVETLFESACAMSFVPRFSRYRVWARSLVVLPYPYLRRVRWIRSWYGTEYTDVSPVPAYPANDGGIIDLGYGGYAGDLEIGFEHGLDSPPADVLRAALTFARAQVNLARTGVPDRATSMQLPDGGSVTLATPGVGRWHTGIPSVDEVLRRYDQHGPRIG